MIKRIPPHIAWPAMIIGFLLLGVTWSLGVVVASQSDGGPSVVADYYEKAISWDDEMNRRTQSDAQNWDLSIALQNTADGPQLNLTVRDVNGSPVSGFEGTITAMRPQDSQPVTRMPLNASQQAPGVYSSPFPELTSGLWDFHIDAEKDTQIIYTTVREEF